MGNGTVGRRFGALGLMLALGLSVVTACSEDSSKGEKKPITCAGADACPTGDQCCIATGASNGVCQAACECIVRADCEPSRTSPSDLLTCCDGSCLVARPGECRDNADCGGTQCERLDPEDCFGRCAGGFGGNGGAAGAGGAGGAATGGSATGGSATGGSATGGSATGGSATGGSATGGASGSAGAGATSGAAGMSTGGTAGQSAGGAAAGGAAGSGTGGGSTGGMSSGGSAGTASGGTSSGGTSSGGSAGGGSTGGPGDPCNSASDCNNTCVTGSGSPPQTHVYAQICQNNKCARGSRIETCGLKCDGNSLRQQVCSAGACQLDALVEDCSAKLFGSETGCYACEDKNPSRCVQQPVNGGWSPWVVSTSGKVGNCSMPPGEVWYSHVCDNPPRSCGGIWCYWTTGAPGGPSGPDEPEWRCGLP